MHDIVPRVAHLVCCWSWRGCPGCVWLLFLVPVFGCAVKSESFCCSHRHTCNINACARASHVTRFSVHRPQASKMMRHTACWLLAALATLCSIIQPCSCLQLQPCPHSSDLWCLATFAGIPPSCQQTHNTLYCRAASVWLGANEQPHKPLVPVSQNDIVGMLLAAAALFFAAGGGLGGGGLLIPIYLTVMRTSCLIYAHIRRRLTCTTTEFPTRGAVAMSNVTIVGGALGNLLLNIGRRHPLRPGPLIDWVRVVMGLPCCPHIPLNHACRWSRLHCACIVPAMCTHTPSPLLAPPPTSNAQHNTQDNAT